jgi:hypothetical protein
MVSKVAVYPARGKSILPARREVGNWWRIPKKGGRRLPRCVIDNGDGRGISFTTGSMVSTYNRGIFRNCSQLNSWSKIK